jgi:hypothetical protein
MMRRWTRNPSNCVPRCVRKSRSLTQGLTQAHARSVSKFLNIRYTVLSQERPMIPGPATCSVVSNILSPTRYSVLDVNPAETRYTFPTRSGHPCRQVWQARRLPRTETG